MRECVRRLSILLMLYAFCCFGLHVCVVSFYMVVCVGEPIVCWFVLGYMFVVGLFFVYGCCVCVRWLTVGCVCVQLLKLCVLCCGESVWYVRGVGLIDCECMCGVVCSFSVRLFVL